MHLACGVRFAEYIRGVRFMYQTLASLLNTIMDTYRCLSVCQDEKLLEEDFWLLRQFFMGGKAEKYKKENTLITI